LLICSVIIHPQKVGPLAHDDEYMPNMMKMHAKGILDHLPLLTHAAHLAATTISSTFIPHMPSLAFAPASVVGPHAYSQPVNINLYIDGKQVETFVLKDLTRDLKLNGMGRVWR